MHPAGSDAYPVSERLKAKFKTFRAETFKVSSYELHPLVTQALEFVGEVEHDPSLLWPEMYENVDKMSDEYIDGTLRRIIDNRLEVLADTVFEFVGFALHADDN